MVYLEGSLSNFLPLFSHQHTTFPRFINHVRTGTQCVHCVLRIYICSASVKMLGGNYYTAGHSSFFSPTKGQLISKCIFGIFNSSKKRVKKIRLYYYGASTRIVFVRFLGGMKIPKIHFEIN